MSENNNNGIKHDFRDLLRDLEYVKGNFFTINNTGLSFHQTILFAFMKADERNFVILEKAYPEHGHVVRSHKDPNYFLKSI